MAFILLASLAIAQSSSPTPTSVMTSLMVIDPCGSTPIPIEGATSLRQLHRRVRGSNNVSERLGMHRIALDEQKSPNVGKAIMVNGQWVSGATLRVQMNNEDGTPTRPFKRRTHTAPPSMNSPWSTRATVRTP